MYFNKMQTSQADGSYIILQSSFFKSNWTVFAYVTFNR